MKESHKRSRSPKTKKIYRVKNWSQYDKALRNRGDITIWFSEEAIQEWAPKQNGKQGRPKKYPTFPGQPGLSPVLLSLRSLRTPTSP